MENCKNINYVDNVSIWGLMNSYCSILDDVEFSFAKNKAKTKVTVTHKIKDKEFEDLYDEVNYMYIDDEIDEKGAYSSEQIISIISYNDIEPTRKSNRELYETIHKYHKCIKTINLEYDSNIGCQDILNMIEQWRYSNKGGMKYRWNEHAGIDKAFFRRYFLDNDFKKKYNVFIFVHEATNKIIGYSVIPKKVSFVHDDMEGYNYVIRKCLLEDEEINKSMSLRNITLYIDWVTFHRIHTINKPILINWGCSSGGVKKYKISKWPLYDLTKKWFYKVKKK